jgi:hypothetical protein
MKTTSTNNTGLFRQIVTLVITLSALIMILIFTIWLYIKAKDEVTVKATQHFSRAASITKDIVELKKMELKALSNSLVNGPILKGALTTMHKETIEDTLNNLVQKNKLKFALILEDKNIKHGVGPFEEGTGVKQIVAGNLIGVAKFTGRLKGYKLLLGLGINKNIIASWNKVTDSSYSIFNKSGEFLLSNKEEKSLAWQEKDNETLHVDTEGKFYYWQMHLLKETLPVQIFVSKEKFWHEFHKTRNSLIFVGVTLFFLSLIMATFFAKFLENYLAKNFVERGELNFTGKDFQALLCEIESLKGQVTQHEKSA